MVDFILFFVAYLGYRYLFERRGRTGAKWAFVSAILALFSLLFLVPIASAILTFWYIHA